MKPITIQFPEYTEECIKAYLLGYRNGYNDGINGKTIQAPQEPIETMELSVRAYNCLCYAGYRYISEVAALNALQIRQMRNLGKVSANEIVHALHKCGIQGTDWDLFLL